MRAIAATSISAKAATGSPSPSSGSRRSPCPRSVLETPYPSARPSSRGVRRGSPRGSQPGSAPGSSNRALARWPCRRPGRFEIDRGDAKRRTHLVLAAITTADVAGLVEDAHANAGDAAPRPPAARARRAFFRQREHGDLGSARPRAGSRSYGARFVPPCRSASSSYAWDEQRQQRCDPLPRRVSITIGWKRSFVSGSVIGQVLCPRTPRWRLQIPVAAVVDALDLLPAEREHGIRCRPPRSRSAPARRPCGRTRRHALRTQRAMEAHALVRASARTTCSSRPRVDEVLQLGLLELARAEREVARVDLVAERLARSARCRTGSSCAPRFANALRSRRRSTGRLGAQVRVAPPRPRRAPMCVLNIRLNCRGSVKRFWPQFGQMGSSPQVVLAEPLVTAQALHERVVEPRHVTAGLPDPRGHDDRGLQADDVVAELDHRPPPGTADVAAQLHTEWTVVPRRAQPTVDLAGWERDASPLGEGRDGLHQVGHGVPPLSRPLAAAAGVCSSLRVGPAAMRRSVWRDDVVPD